MKNSIQIIITILWLFSLAVLGTIYSAWLFYPWEVDQLNLLLEVTIGREELLKNFHILMVYLTSPFSNVLDMPDFPSSASGLKHFADVKNLFHIAQLIFIILAYPAVRFLWKNSRANSLWLYQRHFMTAALVPFAIGFMGVMIGFDNFFTLFHNVLFPGDSSWLFNPHTDPIIQVLPAEFFLHCFILFFFLYEGFLLFFMWKARTK